MKRRIANIIAIILIAILLPVAIINLTLTIKSYVAPEKVATVLGWGPLIVETGSMRPEFAEQDLLLIKQVDAGKLQKDDIIAYYDEKGIVVSHRIIGYSTDDSGARLYITQGDANNVPDRDPVPGDRVAGQVVRVIPQGGRVFNFLSKPIVTMLLVGVPLALFFGISSLLKTLAARKNKKGEMTQSDEPQPEQAL